MTVSRYLFGVLLLAVALGPIVAAAWKLRRRFLPGWEGPLARLVESIIAISQVLVVSEVLGLVSLYRTAPEVIALAGTGAALWRWAGRAPADGVARADVVLPSPVLGRAGTVIALVATAAVAAAWGARTAQAFHHGMGTIDTLWYHMPVAVRFVQESSIRSLHFTDSAPVVAFYPANSPVFHGLGILLLGSDILSPSLNLAWASLALLAAWCIGRPYGVAPATLVGALIVLATPGFVATQPGGAYTDTVGLACLLAAIAVVVNLETGPAPDERVRTAAISVAALATGLALGTKFTFIGPAAALTLGAIVLAPRTRRARESLLWLGGLTATGSFWYFRNLFTVGNPLPALGLHFGPFSLPEPTVTEFSASISRYMFSGAQWRNFFIPGFNRALGPAWPAILGLGLVAFAAAALSRAGIDRLLAFVGIVSLVTFIFTKQFIGTPKQPFFFVVNVRYGSPAYVLGLVLLPMVVAPTRRRLAAAILVVYALAIAAVQLDPTLWPTSIRHNAFEAAVRGTDAGIGVAFGVLVLALGAAFIMLSSAYGRRRSSRPLWIGSAVAAVLVVSIGGAALNSFYLDRRYVDSTPFPHAYAWARTVHHARIGVVGPIMQLQYPFAGKDLSNYVQYLGVRGPHGNFTLVTSCATWVRLVNAGRYDYLVLEQGNTPSPLVTWTRHDPGARELAVHDTGVSIYRIVAALDARACTTDPATVPAP